MRKQGKPVLGEKEQELIAVGASIASGCLPCTQFHLRLAASVGASRDEILQSVEDAAGVRLAATEIMAAAGRSSSAGATLKRPALVGTPSQLRELAAIAAAYALNCTTGLEAHMKAARALGATDKQMFAALKIACAVREAAGQKARVVAGSNLGVGEAEALACGGETNDGGKGDCRC